MGKIWEGYNVGIKLNKCNQSHVNCSGKKCFQHQPLAMADFFLETLIGFLSQGTKPCERDFSSSIPISPPP